MRRSHRRISCIRLPKPRSLGDCSLYFCFLRVFALSHLSDGPKYLSRGFAEHFNDVVLRHFLRRMPEKNEMVSVARHHGALDQSAWRLFAWFSDCWHFLRRGLAQTG